jgi:hypothetical protein
MTPCSGLFRPKELLISTVIIMVPEAVFKQAFEHVNDVAYVL